MSFTCGHFGSGGGVGVEIGKPAAQNLFVGIKRGDRKSQNPIRCLPFLKSVTGSAAAAFEVGQVGTPTAGRSFDSYPADQIQRHFGWATDRWVTPDFSFSIYSPFGSIPETQSDTAAVRASLLPAVIATLEVDNRQGTETKTAVFAIDHQHTLAFHLLEKSARCRFSIVFSSHPKSEPDLNGVRVVLLKSPRRRFKHIQLIKCKQMRYPSARQVVRIGAGMKYMSFTKLREQRKKKPRTQRQCSMHN